MENTPRRRIGAHLRAVLLLTFWTTLLRDADGQETFNDLTGFSLNPTYFNLAEGSRISATATCGQDETGAPRVDLYCKLVGGPTLGLPTQNIQGQFCDYCNSLDPNKAHPVTNAIDGTERWWQSPPLSRGMVYNEVNVTLDLGQLFHVAYILIKFANSPRPDLWVLERSVDNGRKFTPWQYFAHSKRECIETFGKQPNGRIFNDDDQICTTEYSRIIPLENGEIVVSLINGRPGSKNFTYSPVLRDFTKATNIRLRFLRTSTLLGHLISKAQRDPTVTRRYFYSIKDISIGGRCVCHGHAQVCGFGRNLDNPSRLHCKCQHNTCGESCDRCCPGFNQKPWRAATVDSSNDCQPCQCFTHASDCYYDPEVEKRRASLDTFGRYSGGGVCISCQHNTAGINCESCIEGFYRPFGVPPESPTGCIPCSCDERITAGCEMGSGRCICKPQFAGESCDRCADGHYRYPECIPYSEYLTTTQSPAGPIVGPTACPPGYFNSPRCQPCICDYRGTVHTICDVYGRCLCRRGVEGERCDRCEPGHYSFPNCQACRCGGAGVAESVCSPNGQCNCLPNYQGHECDQCAPGFYGYPDCAACRCSSEGSYGTGCNPLSGECLCLPGVVGQQCDRCASGLRFPQCSDSIGVCNPDGSEVPNPLTGICRCRANVEGTLCDRCKPLYWNLAADNPHGCTECQCDLKGTLSGVGECEQREGQCHCKPNVCSHACDSCKDGYFLLQKKKYFGCQACQCDLGGAVGMTCDQTSGQCQCRENVTGRTCAEPSPGYFFPSLHQLKFEVEDGTTPNSRPVRFGFDPQEFPEFSWRGYAVMSPAQSEARVTVHVDPKEGRQNFFHVVLRFINPNSVSVTGSIKATNSRGTAGENQSKEVIFPPSSSPSFVTVPRKGFTEPYALNPGKWIIHIRAEGVLLDYLVLLPRDYYEASLLKEEVTQPCTYLHTASKDENCLLHKHITMDGFSSVLATQGRLTTRSGRRKRRQARVRRPTPDHPDMAALNGRQSRLELSLRVPHSGLYTLILEYASEMDSVQNVNILISGQSGIKIMARANIYSCVFSTLCRSVAVDSRNQVAMLQLSHRTEVLLQTSTTSFLLYKIYAVPAEEFSLEYVEPKVLCVSTHGRFTQDSRHCVQRRFDKPSSSWVLYATRDGQLSSTLAAALQRGKSEDWRRRRQSSLFSVHDPQSDGTVLKFPQTEISFTPVVPLPARYVVVVHYHQPEHISFLVEVRVNAGHMWKGEINATFCPAVSGCREVVVAEGRIALDFYGNSAQLPSISVIVPHGKTLVLDYIVLVPDSSYSPEHLREKPLDKSADFIKQCTSEGFHIEPRTSSQFCRDSARALVAAYNDGALPCDCDKSGSTGAVCDPVGGQCPCRQHVIGRQCNKCATGYYGFPYCKPCECGRRLCDEVTGRCICPPQTVKPTCDACQHQTFSYHPLLGCENCGCSPTGVNINAGLQCDTVTGQCSCKPRIRGRQCDRCAQGYYRFPECLPCECNQGGVTADVCHPDTGRCLCKKNVEGVECDMCREGSFYFDPSNLLGCSSCFCFEVTNQCQSSNKRRGKFVEMLGWRLESPDREEVPSVLNAVSNTAVADIQELPATVQTLHWVAPQSYLGDRVSSYGGFLTYQSKSFGIPSEGMTLIDRQPDVLLTGQTLSLIHVASQAPLPDRLHQGRVQLLEGNWRHAGTNRPVSRQELMMVLAGLVGLRIRALYFTQTQRLSLGEVGLEEATESGTGGPANTVEVCSCPTEYTGDSCEKCSPGFYRKTSLCLPCECSGLADECEDETGRCLNCKDNTAGDRCQLCKEGYFGNAARRTCRLCPCPFSVSSNSFAVSCGDVLGEIQCSCKPGYTGIRCESCAPGYYGDPLRPGGNCQPCNCNGNGNSCDPRTGVCKNYLEPGDTNTDEHCHECDNCAQTLLSDLEKLDIELARIKAQLDNASISGALKERLNKLEKAVSDTKTLVNKFSSAIDMQKSKVDQLEEDADSLADDIKSMKDKADKSAGHADKAMGNAEKTYKRAKDLEDEIQKLLAKIKDLLFQLKNDGRGDSLPADSLTKMLEKAQSMVTEMKNRNFTSQKTAAETERAEAIKLLDYIKNNFSKQSVQNEAAAEKIRSHLKDYNAKLKDLEEALEEARNLVKKANTQNGLNAQTLKNLEKRIDDLKGEGKTVKSQIAVAEGELKKTEDLVKMLSDSKMDYEVLAAQLDGAKTDLTKKVNEIAKAAAKKDLVEAAEEHAKKLSKLAKQIEDAMKNASGLPKVRDAKDAIEAYKNITDAIKAAEAAAVEAKDAADNALNIVNKEKLTDKVKELKDKSSVLLNKAKTSEKYLQDTASNLNDLKNRLAKAKEKKNALKDRLSDVQSQLDDTNRDAIGDMIEEAKRKATSANNTAANTMDKLNKIRKEIDKISVSPVNANLSNDLNEVDQSVKDLLKTIPSLNDKISEVENLTSGFSGLGNISENIMKIKELIEQARDAANKIAIPMNFAGEGHVELRPPKNLDDLKAYTTLSLLLQRPKARGDGNRRRRQAGDSTDMFVLYLGNRDSSKNYIGMVLRKNRLYGLYKLNGQEYELESDLISTSDPQPATFDKVDLHRIYQDVELKLTKDITSGPLDKPYSHRQTNEGAENKSLLKFSPDDVVFYVGGYPSNFTPPPSMKLPKYTGCIEFSTFNRKFMSLYNFQNVERINVQTPCKRTVSQVDSDFYEGTGYGRVVMNQLPRSIDISFKSSMENALLFFTGDENNYFMVTVENGYIVLHSNVISNPYKGSEKLFPTQDNFLTIKLSFRSDRMNIIAISRPIIPSFTEYDFNNFKDFYIGGVTQELRKRWGITALPYKGCLKDFIVNNNIKPIDEPVGISKGCLQDSLSSFKAQFNLGSSLKADLQDFSLENNVAVSIGFKSTETQGVILQNKQLENQLNIAMENGYVILHFDTKKWKSSKQYNDGNWHYVTVTKKEGRIALQIDDEDYGQEESGTISIPNTDGSVWLGKENFKGCISNFYTRRQDNNVYKPANLYDFQATGDVNIDVCTVSNPFQLITNRFSKKDSVKQIINESTSVCEFPAKLQHAYRMGGPVSSLSYSLPLQVLQPKPHFSLDVRTRSPEGLLFFAATRGGQSHLALYMSKGRIRLSVGKQREIFNREKYNDGKWHSVIFSLEKKKFRLVVDGIKAQDGQLTNSELKSMQQFLLPAYLGSAPESLQKELKSKAMPKQSVSGCVRNFKMNGALMLNPSSNYGAGPCFEGPTQKGVYFAGNGAHIVINDSFVFGSDLELLFNIRPRSQTGLLLHVGDSTSHVNTMDHFLSIYMLGGEVVAHVNNGRGEYMTSVKPKTSLCDGIFHKISVIKRKNVVQLSVDTLDNYKIGPPSSTFPSTKDPLYVGGIPEALMQQMLPVTSSFVGCIQDMKINDVSVSFHRSSGVFGPVNLKECPG
ncbi:laminin subunit alpha-3 isoform X1 [Xiphophorus couchianus]|uniref:laminin subunit alpha-3 isoform X1 n=1 Tax=Xiphophorus couchianus TaxID=32473 RepID=UPI001016FBF2|nr:laminin subunit alpha-3 isoform X1 [Xiphophorus couchianus]